MTERTEAQIAAERAREERWVSIKVRVTPEEMNAIKRKAGNRPVAGFVRTLVREALKD